MSKTVIVTGASRGIGRAISLYYAKKGFNVCVCCHKNADMLDALKDEIENIGADCMTYVGNIGIFENAAEFFSLIKERFGKADILINNAGISIYWSFARHDTFRLERYSNFKSHICL